MLKTFTKRSVFRHIERGMLLDISKAFEKVWLEGLILKSSRNGISGNLLYLLEDFLKYRKQRVVLNSQNSSWKGITSGVSQGSILGTAFVIDLSTCRMA